MASEMRLEPSQQMRLEQRMKFTAQMIHSMEILQLPLLALEERIEQEMEQNPVLEVRENDETAEAAPQEPADDDSERDLVVKDDPSRKEDFERLNNIADQIEPEEFADHYVRPSRLDGERDPKMDAMANTPARGISLHEYLIFQWHLVEAEPLIKACGEIIINHIDDDGYLRTGFEELARKLNQSTQPGHWEQALQLVQRLDPPGVGARDLKECLLLQLDQMGDDHRLERELISHHLHDLELNRYPQIVRKTGATIEQINRAMQFIRSKLNPRPGSLVGESNVPYIVPDVIVEYDDAEGDYRVTMADERLPRLYISSQYRRMLKEGQLEPGTRQFIRKNIGSARWLIDSIEQRRNTIRRVAEAAVQAQKEFLDSGPQYLKPLPMTQVADQLGIHVATVSRAVADKYVQTPRGIYPLRYFFSGGTETEDGESLSWDAVKAKLEQIVANEDKSKPLSDDQIVKELAKQGITLARRTVAKYRQILNIPTARRRKQFQ